MLGEPIYEVDARMEDKVELELIPPSRSLVAPWAKRPEPVVKQKGTDPESVFEQKAAQKTLVSEKGESSALSPSLRVATSNGEAAIARPRTARPQTASPEALKISER
jgi:hypothetical protein